MEQLVDQPWPFDVPPETAVVTTTYVTRDRMEILYVTHEFDDTEGVTWQFHCGNDDYRSEVLRLVRLDEILAIDPGIVAVARVPLGHSGRRTNTLSDWIIGDLPPGVET